MKSVTKKPNINTLLELHFAEDKANFKKMDERNNRTEQLLAQMGEHLSHIRKDINIINESTLAHQEESKAFRINITQMVERIDKQTAPIIAEDARQKTVAESDKKRAESIKYFAGLVASFSALSAAGWWIITKVINYVK